MRKLICLLTALLLTLTVFVACENNDTPDGTDTGTTAAEEVTTEAAEEVTTEELPEEQETKDLWTKPY